MDFALLFALSFGFWKITPIIATIPLSLEEPFITHSRINGFSRLFALSVKNFTILKKLLPF